MESTRNYIQRYRAIYQQLKPVNSPALKSKIIFTSEGFNHLLFKHGHRRTIKQIRYRLPLIKLIIPTIKSCDSVIKILETQEKYKHRLIDVTYIELSAIVSSKSPAKIKLVIKKRGLKGKYFFFSVMKQKTLRK